MKQLLQYPRAKTPTAHTLPDPIVGPGQVLIQTRASLISAGTERQSVQLARASLVQKAKARPDLVRQALQKVKTEGVMTTWHKISERLAEPLIPGYSAAGIVIGFGDDVPDYRVGDRVACSGQDYASHAETVCVPKNLVCPIPPRLPFAEAAFVSLGAIALQGIRTAAPQLGETVAVIGLGLVGQLTVQLLSAQGCRVIGVDPDLDRCQLAADSGRAITATPEAAARAIAEAVISLSRPSSGIASASCDVQLGAFPASGPAKYS